MRTKVDLYYFIIVTQYSLKSTAINIEEQYPVSGIFTPDIYPEIKQFSDLYDYDKTFIVNLYGKKNSFKNCIVRIKFFILLMRLHIDILHTTLFYALDYFWLYFFCKRTILTVHDPIPHSFDESIKSLFYRYIAFILLKNFIVLNETQKDEFITRYRLKNKNIFVSRLGIYDYLHRYSGETDSLDKDEYILFFGRITSYKGLEYLFPAMKIVHDKHNDIKLKIAGYCANYYFDISEYEEYSYIEIINKFIPDNELAELIKNALFVVCPYSDATQSGVVMSAFAFNIPILATNVGGLVNYVEHMKSGYIIQPKSISALVQGINYLIEHKKILNEQKKYIAEKYSSGNYSWNKITDGILTFYKDFVLKTRD